MSNIPEGPKSSDTEAKTLALLRRLLVGNGYSLEDIKLKTVQETDLHLPGRLMLELQVVPTETRVPGLPKGNEAAVFKSREELAGYIGSFHSELAEDPSWVEELRARLAKSPTGGWGLEQGDWDLAKQTKRVALVLPCDICRGQKNETCRQCHGQREVNCRACNGAREMWCPTCSGNGVNPNDRNSPCTNCRGKMKLACHTCQAKGRTPCANCRATGLTLCIECQGHGFFVEETLLKVAAQGRFMLGSLTSTPKGVTQVIDALGAEGLARGHAVITPMPSPVGTAIDYDALLPYGRYNLNLKGEIHDVIAVGMKPVLSEFPPLLDDTLSHVPADLNAGTLVAMSKKYRLIRELAEAMGRGEKPARFFSQRYPFGLTAPLAMAIHAQLKKVFASTTLMPRVMASVISAVIAGGIYYSWLNTPRFDLPVPPMAVDGAIAVILALLGWATVGLVGQWAIKRVMPMRATISAAGGLVALITLALILLIAAGLLYMPETRPAWLGLYIK